jgi:hypothetical protein
MIKANLMPKIQVVYPYEKPAFGRVIITNRETVRARLLAASLNSVVSFIKAGSPETYQLLLTTDLSVLNQNGQTHFRSGQELRPEDINLFSLLPGSFIGSMHQTASALNQACGDRKVGGKYVEFMPCGLEGYPNSLILIIERRNPIDNRLTTKSLRDLFSLLNFDSKGGLDYNEIGLIRRMRKDKIYTEQEIYETIVKRLGHVGRNAVAEWLDHEDILFLPIIRPRRLESEKRLFIHRRSKIDEISPGIAIIYFSHILQSERQAALVSEIDELVREGRVKPVIAKGGKVIYFSSVAFEQLKASGYFIKDQQNRDVLIEDFPVWRLLNCEPIRAETHSARLFNSLSASQFFLKYFAEKSYPEGARKVFPILTSAIEMVLASPRGTEPYVEAAKIAAEKGASEEMIATLLLQRYLADNFVFDGHGPQAEKHPSFFNAIPDKVVRRARMLQRALRLDISLMRIGNANDLEIFIQLFLNLIYHREVLPWEVDVNKNPFFAQEQKNACIEFFSTVVGILRHTPAGGLGKEKIAHVKMVVAPLAERCELKDLADMIREEIFRISDNRTYLRIRNLIQKTFGMSHFELDLHLRDVVNLFREAFTAAGIPPNDYELFPRTKIWYSLYEKLKTNELLTVANIYDLLGIIVAAKDDQLINRISEIISSLLPEISGGLLAYMRNNNIPLYKNEIRKPRPSRFSAISLRRVTNLGLPIEVQITSRERHKINTEGEAAHWKYKVRSEAAAFFGISIKRIGDPLDFDTSLRVVMYGDWAGSLEETLRGGLRYKIADLGKEILCSTDYINQLLGLHKGARALAFPIEDLYLINFQDLPVNYSEKPDTLKIGTCLIVFSFPPPPAARRRP